MDNNVINKPPKGGVPTRRVPRRSAVKVEQPQSRSLGEWLYLHSVGLLTVIAVFVVGGVALAVSSYDVKKQKTPIVVEFIEEAPTPEKLEELKQKRDQLQEDINRRLAEIQKIQNLQSNEAAEESGGETDLQLDEQTQEMMSKIASDMGANREEYELGSRAVDGKVGGTGGGSGGGKGSGKSNNFKGAVTVEYKFENPTRVARGQLYAPAYRSKEAGIVVVDVWLNRNGEVTDCRIQSTTNSRLNAEALAAVRNAKTRFDINPSAPLPHRGTITYTFVAQ